MTKNQLSEDLKSYAGGMFITGRQLADFMGYSRQESVAQYVEGLPNISKRYYIPDVSERLMERFVVK